MFYTEADWARIIEMPLVPTETRFSISVAGKQEEIAGWIFSPFALPDVPVVVALLPGATYGKDYWHLVGDPFPGKSYSFAQYLAEETRAIVIALDHLGTGESSCPPDGRDLTIDVLAEAIAAVMRLVQQRLEEGTLVPPKRLENGILLPGLPPIARPLKVVIGHSMGAGIAAYLQAAYQSFDALGLLGWSQALMEPPAELIQALTLNLNGYVDPAPLRALSLPLFYGPSVSEALIEADGQRATRLPGGMVETGLRPESTRAAAAVIRVPTLLGFGEIDLAPNPHTEVSFYPQAQDISLFVLPGSAHCHNLAPTRQQLWEQVALWLRRIAHTRPLAAAA